MKVMHIVAPVLCLILAVNVFIYMILTSSVSNEEGEKVNVVSDSVALDGRDGADGEYARKMTTSKPSKTGLYHESSEIVEMWSTPEVDRFVQPADKQPTIVVFYAAWCPHCRFFIADCILSAFSYPIHSLDTSRQHLLNSLRSLLMLVPIWRIKLPRVGSIEFRETTLVLSVSLSGL